MIKTALTKAALLEKLAELEAVVADLQAKVAELTAENAELKRRLGLNSRNSSKPPSSDSLSKPRRTKSLREPGKKPSGGQRGHKGETLQQTATPDFIERHVLTECPACAASLSHVDPVKIVRRQVVDVPLPSPMWTEHQGELKCCPDCRQLSMSSFPKGVNAPVQHGENLQACAVYLAHQQLIPEARVQQTLSDLFGVAPATATLAAYGQFVYDNLAEFDAQVLEQAKTAPVKHLDETGFRVGGQTDWLHVLSTLLLTYFHVAPTRKSLLDGLTGTVVHDHYQPYFQLSGVLHALCGAHILRELKALIEHDQEPWARHMQWLLRFVSRYRNAHPGQSMPDQTLERLTTVYRHIVNLGLEYHESLPLLPQKKRGKTKRRQGHNLARRLQKHENDVLRCLRDPAVPFTNNLAERDIRMMKLRQKISGGFRSHQGAAVFARIRGFISTARKQGWNIFQTLRDVIRGCGPPAPAWG